MGASPYPEQWPSVKVSPFDAPHGPSPPSFLFLPHLVLPFSCQPRVDTLGPALGFPHSWRAGVTEVYAADKQPVRSILWDNQTVVALPAVGSGKGSTLCLHPIPAISEGFWRSLSVSGSLYGVFILLPVFPACFCMCLLPGLHSNPFMAPSPDNSGFHVRSYERFGATKLCKHNWISDISVLKSPWQFLPPAGAVLWTGRGTQNSPSSSFKVCPFSQTSMCP